MEGWGRTEETYECPRHVEQRSEKPIHLIHVIKVVGTQQRTVQSIESHLNPRNRVSVQTGGQYREEMETVDRERASIGD